MNDASAGFTFFQEMPTSAVKKAFFALQFRICLAQLKQLCIAHVTESSSLIFHKMGCRHYFVVDRLEDLVDEGGSRSSSRVHEHENFRLVSQLNVAIQIF